MKTRFQLLFRVSAVLLSLLLFLLFVSCNGSDRSKGEEQDESPPRLCFGSYNIKHGANAGFDMSKLAKNIVEAGLDVVGLQEVDQCTTRVNGLDSMKALSEATGYPHYAFFKAMDYKGGEYGVGILSKHPIMATERTELYAGDEEPRVLGRAEINANGITLHFFVTHLSFESLDLRTAQLEQIADTVKGYENFLLAGDFNTANFAELSVIANADAVNNAAYSVSTFPGNHTAIDNVVYCKEAWRFSPPQVQRESYSDHYMLYAEAEYMK